MSLDSEDPEIYCIAEIETKGNGLFMLQTSNQDDQTDLYADDPLASKEWTVKYQGVEADKEQSNSE